MSEDNVLTGKERFAKVVSMFGFGQKVFRNDVEHLIL